jgi:hypothetical protein
MSKNERTLASMADSGTGNYRWHVVTRFDDKRLGVSGYTPACGVAAIMSNQTRFAADIAPEHHCKKPACAKAFATAK